MSVSVVRVLVASLAAGALAACTSSPSSPSGPNARDTFDSTNAEAGGASCRALFSTILTRERNGDTAGAINPELDDLGERCPDRYRVFADYMSIKGFADIDAGGPCSEYASHDMEAEAVRLARRDGYCSGDGQVGLSTDAAVWSCAYSPTPNYDWHDDVVCSRGDEQDRPYLREWDSFVTEAEIMESAREYEAQLNGG